MDWSLSADQKNVGGWRPTRLKYWATGSIALTKKEIDIENQEKTRKTRREKQEREKPTQGNKRKRIEVRHCGLVGSAPAWDGTGCEFDSWQCRIYIPCSLSLRLLGSLRGSLDTYGLTQKLCLKKVVYRNSSNVKAVKPRGLASVSRPKNLASAKASWVLASASWMLWRTIIILYTDTLLINTYMADSVDG